jgi:hypothetical protein
VNDLDGIAVAMGTHGDWMPDAPRRERTGGFGGPSQGPPS